MAVTSGATGGSGQGTATAGPQIHRAGAESALVGLLETEQRMRELQSLQAYRVRRILLVASLYDSFTLSEGQHLTELLIGAYHYLSQADPPRLDRVATRDAALNALRTTSYDLVITMANAGPMPVAEFGREAKAIAPDTLVYLMAYNSAELDARGIEPGSGSIDRAFLWRGDVRLLATLIKLAEDARNARPDALIAGVRTIILVEDGVAFYSTYLPLLFGEVTRQTDRLIEEGVNTGQRLLRRRLRPRIVHATSFEEGWELYESFPDTLLCMIADLRFPRRGVQDPLAGVKLLRRVRATDSDVPLLLQSSQADAEREATALGAGFLHKESPTLLHELHDFMLESLGFGDFVFRTPHGDEVARAADLPSMLRVLRTVPPEALVYHGLRNHFSNWLMARTEFSLATALRKMKVTDFDSVEEMRDFLCVTFANVWEAARRGEVEDFIAERFRPSTAFVRIGAGSLGGKGRGLAFMHEVMSRGAIAPDLRGLRVIVPRSAVVGTEAYDQFVESNDLLEVALREADDHRILQRFLASPLPRDVLTDLEAYLAEVDFPLAVRSSSLLEDSRHLPAAGIYPTHMLPNRGSLEERLALLVGAIRHIYASCFFQEAKAYLAGAPGRVEDEKMAIVLQEVIGRRHGRYMYPDIAGVARSHDVYAVGGARQEEGIVVAALGLGRTVVEGERALRFSPVRPRKPRHFSTVEEILQNAQREFWALDLESQPDLGQPSGSANIVRLGLDKAKEHGTLAAVASVYSPDNDAVYDGLSRPGVPLVTMKPVLMRGGFPLAPALKAILELSKAGLAGPAEIEFAACLEEDDQAAGELALLQIRPLVLSGTNGGGGLDGVDPADCLVGPCRALGSGRFADLRHIVTIRRDTFDRGQTPAIAHDIGQMNDRLRAADQPYVLIGPGRWGSADRWLGIPVNWSQISRTRVIVEDRLADVEIEPSEGAHFFHNVTSLGIGYFTAGVGRRDSPRDAAGVDWEWIEAQPVEAETPWVRLYALDAPMEVRIDGRLGLGAVLKQVRPEHDPAVQGR